MLSLLPQLFNFQIIAFTILRLTVAVVGFMAGFARYKKPYKWISILYFVTAFFLLIGLYTQAAAILGIVLVCFDWWADKKISAPTDEQKLLHIIIVVILLSLLFTGPGFLAIDKPL
jgi:uncharacterized membrane protein YphA (DoxX/SURF4 family)